MSDKYRKGSTVTLHAAAATLPTPTADAGGAPYNPLDLDTSLRAVPADLLVRPSGGTITGPVHLWLRVAAVWYQADELSADDVTGPELFRLALSPHIERVAITGSPTAGTVDVELALYEVP